MAPQHKPLPSADLVRQELDYNKETGEIKWRYSGQGRNIDRVGRSDERGYVRLTLNYKVYLLHRIIWLYVTGDDPGDFTIDHRNGNTRDNRWENLRLATDDENQRNRRLPRNNTSGVKGVVKDRGMWSARITTKVNGETKLRNFGRFKTIEEATEVIKRAREKMHGEFTNHG
jgi:hypothetical protein